MSVAEPTAPVERPDRQTLTLPELAEVLGVSPWLVYEAARRHELPVPVLRIGRRMVVSKAALERVLAAEPTKPAPVVRP